MRSLDETRGRYLPCTGARSFGVDVRSHSDRLSTLIAALPKPSSCGSNTLRGWGDSLQNVVHTYIVHTVRMVPRRAYDLW